ncbi:hypothetical protein [Streptomyces sp. NPDC058683]|uniref:hypothetical protein n=1 Tax=Streptomyces sp. NPDC058683 TaxID=3346597 RepID=UPI0036680F9B
MKSIPSSHTGTTGTRLSRRSLLTATAVAPLPLGVSEAAAATRTTRTTRAANRTAGRASLLTVGELWEYEQQMADFGLRIGGTRSHERWLDFLEEQFQRARLKTFRDSQSLSSDAPGWAATAWDLAVGPEGALRPVEVSSYYPYSGETSPAGAEAELVDVGSGTSAEFSAHDLRGRWDGSEVTAVEGVPSRQDAPVGRSQAGLRRQLDGRTARFHRRRVPVAADSLRRLQRL